MIRTARAAALVLGLALAGGCALPTATETGRVEVAGPGAEAADISRAKARKYAEDREAVRKERLELRQRRAELLAESRSYRDKAARALRTRGLSQADRDAEAKLYRTLAADRENRAQRIATLIEACTSRASALRSKQQDALREARRFDRIEASAIE